jgi:lipid-A-disaccharide synthase-like uncharacterized protein
MRKPDPVEVVAIAMPMLIEVVSVCLIIACIAVWAALGSGA